MNIGVISRNMNCRKEIRLGIGVIILYDWKQRICVCWKEQP